MNVQLYISKNARPEYSEAQPVGPTTRKPGLTLPSLHPVRGVSGISLRSLDSETVRTQVAVGSDHLVRRSFLRRFHTTTYSYRIHLAIENGTDPWYELRTRHAELSNGSRLIMSESPSLRPNRGRYAFWIHPGTLLLRRHPARRLPLHPGLVCSSRPRALGLRLPTRCDAQTDGRDPSAADRRYVLRDTVVVECAHRCDTGRKYNANADWVSRWHAADTDAHGRNIASRPLPGVACSARSPSPNRLSTLTLAAKEVFVSLHRASVLSAQRGVSHCGVKL